MTIDFEDRADNLIEVAMKVKNFETYDGLGTLRFYRIAPICFL